ncbi:MAG: Octanoyltransferase [Alphaproteobacteria bacterium ADurb.Bin438]|nr:MAG: Octanoyltransferase [Alphaproteobacteria bacterium ADurb.Bin438]
MVEFITSNNAVKYEDSFEFMQRRVDEIIEGKSEELVWFLEHEEVITKGLNAKDNELFKVDIPVIKTNRGGKFTYHGRGQRIIYVMLDLNKRGLSVEKYMFLLEQWIIDSLKEMGIDANRCEKGIGVFVSDMKIASMGLRIKKGISYHGICLNVSPDLKVFDGFIPCGLQGVHMTSLEELGVIIDFDRVDLILKKCFNL